LAGSRSEGAAARCPERHALDAGQLGEGELNAQGEQEEDQAHLGQGGHLRTVAGEARREGAAHHPGQEGPTITDWRSPLLTASCCLPPSYGRLILTCCSSAARTADEEEDRDEVLRFDIRVPRDEVQAELAPLLAQARAEDAHALADQLIHAVRSSGLGVFGVDPTRTALEPGQGDVLLLAPEAQLAEEARRALLRLATTTGAQVTVVEQHALFERLGGVGALLRYRRAAPDPATS
jgi:hypothetical protein